MNISTHLLDSDRTDFSARNRRHLRLRNHLVRNRYYPTLSAATAAFSQIVTASLRKGINAAREIALPAIVVQCAMLGVALSYFFHPAAAGVFQQLLDVKSLIGPSFAFLSMGVIAVIAEALRRASSRNWSGFGAAAIFGFFVFGLLGMITDTFYIAQMKLWSGLSPTLQIVAKVLTDQFIYTIIIANPYQTFLYVFKDCGFRPSAFFKRITPFKVFYVREMLAVLITNWAFWIPTTAIIYSLPLDLQFVISRFAIMIWVLLLTAMTARSK